MGSAWRSIARVALIAVLLSACSNPSTPSEPTELQFNVQSLATDFGPDGVTLSEPGLVPYRFVDGFLAGSALREIGVDAPSIASEWAVSQLEREATNAEITPVLAASLYQLAVMTERSDATVVGALDAGLRRLLVALRTARLGATDAAAAQDLAVLGLAALGTRGRIPCGRFRELVRPEFSGVARELEFASCTRGGLLPPPTEEWRKSGVSDAKSLVGLLLSVRGDAGSASGWIREHGNPGESLILLGMAAHDCGAPCPSVPVDASRYLRLKAVAMSSAPTQVEATGFDSFAANALVLSLEYPEGTPFADFAWQPKADSIPDRVARAGASNVVMDSLYVTSRMTPALRTAIVAAARQRPGILGGAVAHFGDCSLLEKREVRLLGVDRRPPVPGELPPLTRVGVALDISAAKSCGLSVTDVSHWQSALDAPMPASWRPGAVHDYWASAEAGCLLFEELPPDVNAVASSYLARLAGGDFARYFRILDALAATNLRTMVTSGCDAGIHWWGKAPWVQD